MNRTIFSAVVLCALSIPVAAEDLGKLSANPFDPDSTANRFGRYGSPFSQDSINNQYGAGSRFKHDSPNNPYGPGWRIEGQ
ncbi:MAG: hypothetical protein NTAFB01_01840 [Nitrospira sp.]